MSRLPSIGGILSSIAEGAASIVGQIASFFRLGQLGSVEPPSTPEPGRTELTTPEQIVEQAAARHLLPEPQARPLVTTSFICVVTNEDTGKEIRIRHTVEYYEGELSRSGAYSRARRYAAAQAARYFDENELPNLTYSCRTLGTFTLVDQSA